MDMDAIAAKLDAFAEMLRRPHVCDRETSADPDGWTPGNPLWGHCAVVATAAQDRFGGSLLRASLEGHPKWTGMRSHYWNRLPHGERRDFTEAQFGGDPPQGLEPIERTRAYVLSHPATLERFKRFAWRLACLENPDNRLFENGAYSACYMAAVTSPCQKMRFGALLHHAGDGVVAVARNGTIEPIAHLCEPSCIRLAIRSRTESMLGACGHAEEFVMAEGLKRGVKLGECDLYVAGVHLNGAPWLKPRAEHTCLRCAVQMHNAGIRRIFVPVAPGRWASVTTEEALAQAAEYASGKKTV